MPFSGNTFTHLFDWEKDPQRQEKIVNARLEAEFDGIDAALSQLKAGSGNTYSEAILPSASAVTLTNNTAANVISLSLAAGSWDVSSIAKFVLGTTSANNIISGLSTTSATLPGDDGSSALNIRNFLATALTDNTSPSLVGATVRMTLGSTTTVYLVVRAGWSGGTAAQAWGMIRANPI